MAILKKNKKIIGKSDVADIPAFNLTGVRVKIDSGAYTSTIHCSSIVETDFGLEVIFLEPTHKGYTGEKHTFEKYKKKAVRSSIGEVQERFVVKGNIKLFEKIYRCDFTLSNRKMMRFPVLIGRKFLNYKFLIDTTKTNESYNFKKQK
ncbi:MAG: RimK/LysX family protein [Brumimicrobium sp.]